jgi:transcription elongation factor GreA
MGSNMKDDHEYLTQAKFDQFQAELEHLKTVRRKEVAENLEYAKGLGDLSENAEYHEARDMQAAVEDRIQKLEMILKSATIVSTHDTNAVSIGSTIKIKKEGDKDSKEFTIVSSEEADMATGKISVKSPLGAAAYGKKKGEAFSFSTPSGTMEYKIVEIK